MVAFEFSRHPEWMFGIRSISIGSCSSRRFHPFRLSSPQSPQQQSSLLGRNGLKVAISYYPKYQQGYSVINMGLKMLDMLSLGPVLACGFGYFLLKRHEGLEEQRLRNPVPATPVSTGDKELDAILGITAALAAVEPSKAK